MARGGFPILGLDLGSKRGDDLIARAHRGRLLSLDERCRHLFLLDDVSQFVGQQPRAGTGAGGVLPGCKDNVSADCAAIASVWTLTRLKSWPKWVSIERRVPTSSGWPGVRSATSTTDGVRADDAAGLDSLRCTGGSEEPPVDGVKGGSGAGC